MRHIVLTLCLFVSIQGLANEPESKPCPKKQIEQTIKEESPIRDRLFSPFKSISTLDEFFKKENDAQQDKEEGCISSDSISREDLVQQSLMAFWAGILGWLGFFTFLATFGTAVLLYINLRQTNKIIALERAWLGIHHRPKLVKILGDEKTEWFSLIYDIQNTSKTPAHDVEIIWELTFVDKNTKKVSNFENRKSIFKGGGVVGIIPPTAAKAYDIQLNTEDLSRISIMEESSRESLEVNICIKYRTSFSKRFHHTRETISLLVLQNRTWLERINAQTSIPTDISVIAKNYEMT